MHFRIGSAIVALACVILMTTSALAQANDDAVPFDEAAPVDSSTVPVIEPSPVAEMLFLSVASPVEQDVEVPLGTSQLTIRGITLAGAVVSVDGVLVDTDDHGEFVEVTALDEGANEIEIVASDDQGNQVETSIFVTRGE